MSADHSKHTEHSEDKRLCLQCGANQTQTFKAYKNQDFQALKNECLSKNKLFEDPLFPPIDTSISYSQPPPYGTKWKRPSEIVKSQTQPIFIQDEAKCDDLDQGSLGNCWFIAGCAAIAMVPELFKRVVPVDQSSMTGPGYAGIYHFRFWQFGEWYDVVVDDRLPVSPSNELVFCRNKQQPNEFWAALLEKAYAKVCLSYENLDGGFITDALIDMSGGIQESFNIKQMQTEEQRKQSWQYIIKSRQHETLIGCSIAPNPRVREARLYNGLVMGHAYTITRVACIERYGRDICLVRVRNPWGNEVEWRGAWADSSYEWSSLSPEVKQQLGYKQLPDGEFWMAYEDFYRNFETLDFCDLTPDAFSAELDNNPKLVWNSISYRGEWVNGKTAGGCGQPNERAYWQNPQFLVTLTDADPTDKENLATLIISLLQMNTREKRMKRNGEAAEEFIQFRLYKVTNASDAEKAKQTGLRLYANQLEKAATSGSYINLRDVTRRFRLPPGNYMIIPSVYEEGVEGQFLLRIFTEQEIKDTHVKILEDHKPDLNNEDIFFSHGNKRIDILFSNWNSLLNGNLSKSRSTEVIAPAKDMQKTRASNLASSASSRSISNNNNDYVDSDVHEKCIVNRNRIQHQHVKEACTVM